jgi:23S rRNA pseudouridine2605 synthase
LCGLAVERFIDVPETHETMRLNRYLARAGVGSRRDVEVFITEGRVIINGKVIRELATVVHPETDTVLFDSKPIHLPQLVYYKYYKPRGVVSTIDDPHESNNIGELLKNKNIPAGVVPAGRLDKNSEGLLILTNDGDLLQRLMHPSHEVEKIYRVLIDRRPLETDLKRIRTGITVNDISYSTVRVTRMGPQPIDSDSPVSGYWLEIVMAEGKKREIREMLNAVHYPVLKLVRVQHGPVKLGKLNPGAIIELSETEKMKLRAI